MLPNKPIGSTEPIFYTIKIYINILMKEYFIPFEFEIKNYINECLLALGEVDRTQVRAYTRTKDHMVKYAPKFINNLLKHFKYEPLLYRFYVTPANKQLNPHIDGGDGSLRVPMTLNLPILGTENTETLWYDSSDETNYRYLSTVNHNYTRGITTKNHKRLVEIQKLTVNKPYFIKTDIFHAVKNHNDNTRIMLTVRWIDDNFTKGFEFTEPNDVLI